MRKYNFASLLVVCLAGTVVWAAPAMAPAVPDLNLPAETETAQESPTRPVVVYKSVTTAPNKPVSRPVAPKAAPSKTGSQKEVVVTNAIIGGKDEYVEKINPDLSKLTPIPTMAELEAAEKAAQMEPAREKAPAAAPQRPLKVVYNPVSDRDPALSPDDTLLLKDKQERDRRKAEQERKQRVEAERRRILEAERQRQLELERLRDPSREVRGKIKISGIIGQEVFIGNKVYTVGKTVMGARIVSVQPDGVVFMYKGQKFTKKVQLQ